MDQCGEERRGSLVQRALVGVEEGAELVGGLPVGVDGDRFACGYGPQGDVAASVEVLVAGGVVGVVHEACWCRNR